MEGYFKSREFSYRSPDKARFYLNIGEMLLKKSFTSTTISMQANLENHNMLWVKR